MKFRTVKYFLTVALVLALMAGCAAFQGTVDTPAERYVLAASLYNAEYDRYLVDVARTDLLEPEKEMLREKRAVLVRADEVLKIYETYIEVGQSPPVDQAKALEEIINLLTRMAIERMVK